MDLANLSSNWKKLQKNLSSKQKPASHNAKGIANGLHYSQPTRDYAHKRRRLDEEDGRYSHDTDRKRKYKAAVWTGEPKRLSKPATTTAPGAVEHTKSNDAVPGTEVAGVNHDLQTPASSKATTLTTPIPASNLTNPQKLGKYIALDCEMVGTPVRTAFSVATKFTPTTISTNSNNHIPQIEYSILARVSLTSFSLDTIYDAYLLPPPATPITNYRTPFSGITAWHLNPKNATTQPKKFETVQKEVAALMKGRVLVGHALTGDLKVLGLSHPKARIRDTAQYSKFRTLALADDQSVQALDRGDGTQPQTVKGRTPSLKRLVSTLLGWSIQDDAVKGHSSVEDARAAMALFKTEKKGFEAEAVRLFGRGAIVATSERLDGGDGDESAKAGSKRKHAEQDSTDTRPPEGQKPFADEADPLLAEEEEQLDEDEDESETATAAASGSLMQRDTASTNATAGQKKRKRKKKKGKYR